MKIKLKVYAEDGKSTVVAFLAREGDDQRPADELSRGSGETMQDAIPALINSFTQMQQATIDALFNCGLIRNKPEAGGVEARIEKGLVS